MKVYIQILTREHPITINKATKVDEVRATNQLVVKKGETVIGTFATIQVVGWWTADDEE